MARITESQLRSIIKQELKELLESKFFNLSDEPYGLSSEFGDYDCKGMQDAIIIIKNTPDTSDDWYPGKNNRFTKDQIIAFLEERIARRCRG